jgi:uncharacterized protein
MLIRPTRRTLLAGLAASTVAGTGTAAYGVGVEPVLRLNVTPYALTPPGWPPGLSLTAAVIADIHAGEPFMSPDRIAEIVSVANALKPDIVFLLGDYEPGHDYVTREVTMPRLARELSALSAPLGVLAVLGNHDWWADLDVIRSGGVTAAARALEAEGIRVLQNDAVRLTKDGRPFWVAGLEDQMVLHKLGTYRGYEDIPGTMAKVTDDAPVVMLAHEPYIIRKMPRRVSVTLSGHTHGGQVRLFGYTPFALSRFENRYVYGHVIDDGRHVIISGGLGTSKFPVRLGSPPEIVLVRLGGNDAVA